MQFFVYESCVSIKLMDSYFSSSPIVLHSFLAYKRFPLLIAIVYVPQDVIFNVCVVYGDPISCMFDFSSCSGYIFFGVRDEVVNLSAGGGL